MARRTSPPRVGQRDDLHTPPLYTSAGADTSIYGPLRGVSLSYWYVHEIHDFEVLVAHSGQVLEITLVPPMPPSRGPFDGPDSSALGT